MFVIHEKDRIIRETKDYYSHQLDIEYFIEIRGEKTYFNYLELLEKYHLYKTFENVCLLDQYAQELNALCFTYICLYEDYLKEAIFYDEQTITYSSLNRMCIPNLITIITDDEYLEKEILPNSLNLKLLNTFRKNVLEHSLIEAKSRKEEIINFIEALPKELKESFINKLENLNKRFSSLDDISTFSL